MVRETRGVGDLNKLRFGLLLPACLLAAPALASTSSAPENNAASHRPDPRALQLAQEGDVDVFFDRFGRRILLDRETGEVIAVEPGRRTPPPALRREQRRQELRRDGFRIVPPDEADDYEVRRLPDPDSEGFEPDPQDDETDVARTPRQRLPRPDEPGGEYLTPDEPDLNGGDDDQVAREQPPVERRKLDDGLTAQPPPPKPAVPKPSQPSIVNAPVPTSPQEEARAIEAETNPDSPAGAPDVDGDQTASTPPSDAPALQPEPPMPKGIREDVAALQILLDRGGASPGVIDGRFGSNVDKALAAYNAINNANLRSTDADGIKAALAATGGDAFTTYTITAEDAAGPFVAAVPADYGVKAQLEKLGYTSVTEMLGERFHMDETYLKSINPGVNFNRPGSIIRIAQVGAPKAGEVARITADKNAKQVHAYDASGKLLVSYPATIGSPDTPSPSGTHAVARIAFDPEYTYNPKINFKQGENDKVLRIPPGPNGPVGSIWIALDKPTYGIHGTPEPSRIGKAESHGCVRLTNWDAAELAKLVKPGVPVEFVE